MSRITHLTITLKSGGSVAIGDSTVRVLRVTPSGAEIRIEAPENVPILRENAKKKEKVDRE